MFLMILNEKTQNEITKTQCFTAFPQFHFVFFHSKSLKTLVLLRLVFSIPKSIFAVQYSVFAILFCVFCLFCLFSEAPPEFSEPWTGPLEESQKKDKKDKKHTKNTK